MIEFAELIEDIDKLPFESQEILADIINKRLSEIRRERFIEETLTSNNEYSKGDYKEGTSDDLFNAIKIN